MKTYRFLSYYEFFNLLDLGYVILICLQFPLADSLINPNQHFSWDIFTIIHTCRTQEFFFLLYFPLQLTAAQALVLILNFLGAFVDFFTLSTGLLAEGLLDSSYFCIC